MSNCLYAIALLSICTLAIPVAYSAGQNERVKIIYDTDMASDVDDVGALALLNALADLGETEILGAMVSAINRYTAPCLDAINTYYSRPDIPIGCVKGEGIQAESRYARFVAQKHPHDIEAGQDIPDAALLYRSILANQPKNSVVIVTVGFTTNLKNLLNTQPDEFSPLGGLDLVREKVKQWVCMGGEFPQGREYNLWNDADASIQAIGNWPTPIVFSGFEIGKRVMTGKRMSETPEDNPARTAYRYYNNLSNRESWDHTAVLYAVRGLRDYWDIQTGGANVIHEDGSNEWVSTTDKGHAYLIEKMPPAELAAIIEELMIKAPGKQSVKEFPLYSRD
ncbi:MAG: nucleoside hydrolase [bacterium]